MHKSFKIWLLSEDEDMLDGAGKVIDKAISSFNAGKEAGEKINKQQTADDTKQQGKDRGREQTDIIADINAHVESLFERFPTPIDRGGPEQLLASYESRSSALQSFNIYKNMAKTLTDIQKSFNDRLVSTKKIDRNRLKKIIDNAKRDADSGILDRQIEVFAKSEAKFFTELLHVQDDKSGDFETMQFDRQQFIQRIGNRFSKTDPTRIAQTIEALNTLFIYLIDEFSQYAKTIGTAGKQRKESEEEDSE